MAGIERLWIYRAFARAPAVAYRDKVMGLAVVAAAIPFAGWLAPGEGWTRTATVLGCLIGSLLAILCVAAMLRPIRLTARALRAAAEGQPSPSLPVHHTDEAGQMMADLAGLLGRLDAQRHRLSNRHPISGLPTREPFLAMLEADVAATDKAIVLGLARFADYDRLAAFDQAAADQALGAFARRLVGAVRETHLVAQVDRDCFAIWFREAQAPHIAAGELQALGYVLAQELGEAQLSPDVDLGAAIFPHDGDDPATLLTRAFAALPKAGEVSNGKLSFYSAQSSDAAKERFSLEKDLRHAIEREQFMLHYQPVVDLGARRLAGAEALLRWRHPKLGLVSPAEFVPLLEQTGLIDEVGVWVLNTACRQARAWQDAGLTDLKMAVNLSARQFRDPALKTTIVRTLERHRLAPSALEVELTETAAMEDAARTRQTVEDLRQVGVSVAIDDFGAGYSSLSYLKNLPFSKLKIDREFVSKVDERRDSQAICRALVELASGLGIKVLAEGTETQQEVETLRAMGCEMFQGYFFGKPMPGEDFVANAKNPAWLALLGSPARRTRAELKRRVAG